MTARWGARLWRLLACLLLAMAGAVAPVRAAVVDLTPCVARVAAGDSAAAMFASPARFDCRTGQTAFGPGDYWVRLAEVPARGLAGDAVLQLGNGWHDAVDVFARRADGSIWRAHADGREWAARLRVGALAQFALPQHGAGVTDLLVRVRGSANLGGIVPSARLAGDGEAHRRELELTALYAAFVGICLALLGYNFVLWVMLRQRFQAIYCRMTLATMTYALASCGVLARLFPGADIKALLCVNYVSLALVAAFALQFVHHFFEAGTFGRRLRALTDMTSGGLVLAGLGFVVLQRWDAHLADRLYLLPFLPAPLLAGAMMVGAWRRRSPLLKFYLAAWAAPVVMTAARILNSTHLFGFVPWIERTTILAMGCELLISSLGIAYRIKLTNQERDRARTEEAIARRLADSDPLTGLLNRRAFLAAMTARPGAWWLVLADIDHFKAVNDAFGHDAGDQVLQAVAVVLRGWAPGGALVARLGGEEFAIALPGGDDLPDVAALLARVRRQPMTGARPVTVSVGVAQAEVGGEARAEADWRGLYRAADAALYAAKAAGRDCWEHSPAADTSRSWCAPDARRQA
ncbi:MAG: GGDEF domain-containing protein [Sphingomonadales bacterium]|nr:GGDEF domain-containing protein [Sphingomonadales bacterium]